MRIVTKENEYAKIVKLPNGKFALVIGDNHDGYSIVLTKQEIEKVIKILQESIEGIGK